MKDLRQRTLTAIAYAAIVLAAVRGPREAFVALVAAMGIVAAVELFELRRAGFPALLELAVVVAGLASLVYLRYASAPRPIGCGADCMWGPVLMTIVAVWAGDVAAYLVGSWVGRHRIVPRISPGKTWEGTIVGVLAAGAVVILWSRPELGPPASSILIAVLIGPVAFGGDILESWLKRRAGVKDSGTLLPGHGGMLDRIDSLVAAASIVAVVVAGLSSMG